MRIAQIASLAQSVRHSRQFASLLPQLAAGA